MDTILYFYKLKNGGSAPYEVLIKEFELPSHKLIRVGLGYAAVELLEGGEFYETDDKKHGLAEKLFPKTFEKRKLKRMELQKKIILDKVGEHWGDENTTACVCKPPVTYFERWRFTEYNDMKWYDILLFYAKLPYYSVIGVSPVLREILAARAKKMKALFIYVIKSEYNETLEDLAEDLFDEYGLTTRIIVIEGDSYRRIGLMGILPANILDFSGEDRVNLSCAPKGSYWFDFGCSEEKRRKAYAFSDGLRYFSLTDMWSVPEKYDGGAVQPSHS